MRFERIDLHKLDESKPLRNLTSGELILMPRPESGAANTLGVVAGSVTLKSSIAVGALRLQLSQV